MKYEVIMSNGDRAECESIAAALVAGKTMYDDAEGGVFTQRVTVDGMPQLWAREAVQAHIKEEVHLV